MRAAGVVRPKRPQPTASTTAACRTSRTLAGTGRARTPLTNSASAAVAPFAATAVIPVAVSCMGRNTRGLRRAGDRFAEQASQFVDARQRLDAPHHIAERVDGRAAGHRVG